MMRRPQAESKASPSRHSARHRASKVALSTTIRMAAAGRRRMKVVWLQITAAGREAIAG
jgi:hypothetical protein